MDRYVGFYWTLPVPFGDFTALPADVEGAAARSRTVRYQRERVRRWVKDEHGRLVAERAFLELAPDRGTVTVTAEIDAIVALARDEGASLVLVDFAESFGWRKHPALWERLEELGAPYVALPPDPVIIDGAEFDPIAHFRMWADIWDAFRKSKPERKASIRAAIGDLPVAEMTNAEIARALNDAGIKSLGGKDWTKDNVAKFIKSA